MKYVTDHLISRLRDARRSQGLTQRELGARIGVPQSNVARLEGGGTDPKLSSFLEIARALDLDVKLVPRQAASVVDGALRAHGFHHPPDDATSRAIQTIRAFSDHLQRNRDIIRDRAGHLTDLLADLERVRFTPRDHAALVDALRPMTRVFDRIAAREPPGENWHRRLNDTREQLTQLRNTMVHARAGTGPRAAFSLADDDDG